jgi:hypothetical protein
MKNTLFYLVFTSFLFLFFAGCGSNHVGLSGKVTYTDGTPLTVGKVCFVTDTFSAYGTLQKDGTYVVGSLSENDGLPKGNYRVYINGASKLISESEEMETESLIDEKYANSETSGLTVEIPTPNGKFDITVAPNPNAKKE